MNNVLEFNSRARPKFKVGKKKSRYTYYSLNALYGGIELALNAFTSTTFLLTSTQGKEITILRPKKMLQRLLIAIAQMKIGSKLENLLN